MAIVSVYLGRVSGLDEFVIGSPILNRSNVKEKRTSGMFINTVPLKVSLKDNMKFSHLASSISTSMFNIFKHFFSIFFYFIHFIIFLPMDYKSQLLTYYF